MDSADYKVNWVYWKDPEKKDLEELLKDMQIKTIPEIVIDGIKDTVKEGIKKAPILKQVYEMGEDDGKKEGVTKASEKYEDKVKKQAESFEEQKVFLKTCIEELKALMKEYEKYIEEKEEEFENLTKEQLKELKEIKDKYEKLLKIKY